MTEIFEELNYLLGRELKDEYKEQADNSPHGGRILLTRPIDDRVAIHINMFVAFDENYKLSKIYGDKCYCMSRGLYNRSANVYERPFTKKEVNFLKRYIKSITKEQED